MSRRTVYSGLYTHPEMSYDVSWSPRAIARQERWCREIGAEYILVRSMGRWAEYYANPHAWSFGTLIKLAAMQEFLESHENTFVWVDLDVYPTDAAFGVPLPDRNFFYAPLVPATWGRDHGAWHMERKLAWWGCAQPEYFAWSTGMFAMERETVEHFWDWLNRDYDINSRAWWDAYYARQLSLSPESPWNYGSDEAIKEHWLNSHEIEFEQMTDSYHSVEAFRNPLFFHYCGQSKTNYPG